MEELFLIFPEDFAHRTQDDERDGHEQPGGGSEHLELPLEHLELFLVGSL